LKKGIIMKFKLSIATAAAAALLCPVAAWAVPILSIVPSAANVANNSSFTADVKISGLLSVIPNQVVGAYSIDVTYNGTLLTQLGVATDQSAGKMAPIVFDTIGTSAGNAWGNAFSLNTSDAALQALQGDGFTLFRVTFNTGANSGLALLNFNFPPDPVAGLNGDNLAFQSVGASVCVGIAAANCRVVNVPEPASYGLLAIGLLAAGAAGLKRRSKETAAV
jgi:hypothetical protein